MNEHELRPEHEFLTGKALRDAKLRPYRDGATKTAKVVGDAVYGFGKLAIKGLNYLSREGQKSKPKRAVPTMRIDLSSGRNKAQRKFVSEVNDTLKQVRITRAKRKINAKRGRRNRLA